MKLDDARERAVTAANSWRSNHTGAGGNNERVDAYFGCDVFSQRVMRQRLPADAYRKLMRTIEHGEPLDETVLSGLSKKERRRLRKLQRDAHRNAASAR